jgi:hypothetical protein
MSKREITARLRAIGDLVRESLRSIAEENTRHWQTIGEQYVGLGILFDEGAALVASRGEDWREWARGFITADSRVSVSVDTLYRIRNAGAVARVCDKPGDLASAPTDWQGVTYLALVPFYRILAAAKSAEEKTQAETLVRTLVAEGMSKPEGLTVAVAEKLTAKHAPTRGKGTGDAKTTAANRSAAKSRRAARTAAAAAATPAPSKSEEDDSAAREACGKAIGRILKDVPEDVLPTVRTIMVASAKLCEQYNPSTVVALVKGYQRS